MRTGGGWKFYLIEVQQPLKANTWLTDFYLMTSIWLFAWKSSEIKFNEIA